MDLDAARKAAGLNPLPNTTPIEAKPIIVTEDATIGNEERLRGIPAVGRVSGTMRGTRPGIDDLRSLERAGHTIIQGMLQRQKMREARDKLKRTDGT